MAGPSIFGVSDLLAIFMPGDWQFNFLGHFYACWQSYFFGNFYARSLAIRFVGNFYARGLAISDLPYSLPATSSLPLLPLLRASLTFPPTRPQWRRWCCCWQDIRVNNASQCRDATPCQQPKRLNNTFPSPTAGLEEVIAAVSVSISRHLPPPS